MIVGMGLRIVALIIDMFIWSNVVIIISYFAHVKGGVNVHLSTFIVSLGFFLVVLQWQVIAKASLVKMARHSAVNIILFFILASSFQEHLRPFLFVLALILGVYMIHRQLIKPKVAISALKSVFYESRFYFRTMKALNKAIPIAALFVIPWLLSSTTVDYIVSLSITIIVTGIALQFLAERTISKQIDTAIGTNQFLVMDAMCKKLETLPFSTFAGPRNKLYRAMKTKREAMALALRLASKLPRFSYYASIINAAAANVNRGQFGIVYKLIKIDTADNQFISDLISTHSQEFVGNLIVSSEVIERYISAHPDTKLSILQVAPYEHFSESLKYIVKLLNVIIEEDVFYDSNEGLEIIAEVGYATSGMATTLSSGSEKYLVPTTFMGVRLKAEQANAGRLIINTVREIDDYVFRRGSFKDAVKRRLAYDIALFHSKTLKLPIDQLLNKSTNQGAVPVSLVQKCIALLREQGRNELEDYALEILAEQFFAENSEIVAQILGEALTDRASQEISDLIIEHLMGSAFELALEGLSLVNE